MSNNDKMDTRPFGDEKKDKNRYDEKKEENLLFGRIHRAPGLIGIGAVIVVILILLAALISSSFGFVGGIDSLTVKIPVGSEDEVSDRAMAVEAYTDTPAFGKVAEGEGDLTIYYEDQEIYTSKINFTDGHARIEIQYNEFYVDNGDYIVEISFKGKTESDTITLRGTAHTVVMAQKNYTTGTEQDRQENVLYRITLLPNEENKNMSDYLHIPGHGKIKVYYVENKSDQENEEQWENVTTINITTDFDKTFEYQFVGKETKEKNVYIINFDASKLHDKKGDGWYSARVHFKNDFGPEEYGALTEWIQTMPGNTDDSETWIELKD